MDEGMVTINNENDTNLMEYKMFDDRVMTIKQENHQTENVFMDGQMNSVKQEYDVNPPDAAVNTPTDYNLGNNLPTTNKIAGQIHGSQVLPGATTAGFGFSNNSSSCGNCGGVVTGSSSSGISNKCEKTPDLNNDTSMDNDVDNEYVSVKKECDNEGIDDMLRDNECDNKYINDISVDNGDISPRSVDRECKNDDITKISTDNDECDDVGGRSADGKSQKDCIDNSHADDDEDDKSTTDNDDLSKYDAYNKGVGLFQGDSSLDMGVDSGHVRGVKRKRHDSIDAIVMTEPFDNDEDKYDAIVKTEDIDDDEDIEDGVEGEEEEEGVGLSHLGVANDSMIGMQPMSSGIDDDNDIDADSGPPVDRHVCQICDKYFLNPNKLVAHIREEHTGERTYNCEVCFESFYSKTNLDFHLISHNVKRTHACDVCFKCFARPSALLIHKRIHNGERPFVCTICNTAFSQKSTLTGHMFYHTGKKAYACEICGKAFVRPSKLKEHESVHTGEKKYECDVCHKRFRQKQNLIQHEIIHTDIKPYKCEFCEKNFNSRSALYRHIRIHTATGPVVCEVCNRPFKNRNSLNTHRVKIHKAKVPTVEEKT